MNRARWSSQSAFLLAAIGGALGLGNIWRFPYVAGTSGGGAFVIIYIAFIVIIGIPLVVAELALGRRGGQSAVKTMQKLTADEGRSKFWHTGGWFAIVTPIIALTFYSVVASWSLDYIFKAVTGRFSGISGTESGELFAGLLADPLRMATWTGVFLLISGGVVARGVERGLESTVKLLMPALGLIIVGLVIYAAITADFSGALTFLFTPDFSKVTGTVVLQAMGQAFFSLTVGVGAMITYGAYVAPTVSIPRAACTIAAADTLAALLMGLAIFPLVFANGLAPAEGPGLIMVTLPIAFGQVTGGTIVGILFFTLMFIAALTSALAMIEPMVSWLEEQRGLSRSVATAGLVAGVWVVSLSMVLSFNDWSDVYPLGFIDFFATMTTFDLMDFFAANIMVPCGALLLALFAGWAMRSDSLRDELGLSDGPLFRTWMGLVRYVAPLAIGAILIGNLLGFD